MNACGIQFEITDLELQIFDTVCCTQSTSSLCPKKQKKLLKYYLITTVKYNNKGLNQFKTFVLPILFGIISVYIYIPTFILFYNTHTN